MPKRTGSTCLCAAAAALLLSTGAAADDGRPRDPALVAARSKVFGPENVDQRTGAVDNHLVIFSWITNASFALPYRVSPARMSKGASAQRSRSSCRT